ncbi:MAG: dihydroneopterin aldolase [Acetobacteraceae bacterium]|nr:dihydroneopterin aldolase [Acetobacteraceae bacterium]MBV8588783.1 dihydroneopterin aldolase [Acetobacteraceae bacterium]
MTRMMATVKSPQEAEVASVAGADIIDVEHPEHGIFGVLSETALRAVRDAVGEEAAMCATAGAVPDGSRLAVVAHRVAAAGIQYLKVPLLAAPESQSILGSARQFPGNLQLIAILFADLEADFEMLELAPAAGFRGAILDTADKRGGRLPEYAEMAQLHAFIQRCGRVGLFSGLGGGLEAPDVVRLLALNPGLLRFRRALCRGRDRTRPIEPELVRRIRRLVPQVRDIRAREEEPSESQSEAATDRVFVHDLILPVRIGAYSREQGSPQRVRFAVDACVTRLPRPVRDMHDIFSYDIITDTIRLLIEGGHQMLLEALAENIAAKLLAYPRVMRVTVQLEKLDMGAGVVGVALERTRPASSGDRS